MATEIEPRGTIFLSHSSADKDLVAKVFSRLDRSNTFYDVQTISPGEKFIQAMKDGVQNCSVFVLFHSPESQSDWVDFEKSLAEVHSIRNKNLKIVTCPVNGSNHSTLPEWMRSYMTTTENYTVNDIVRSIRHMYEVSFYSDFPEERRVHLGRERLKREISLAVMRAAAVSGKPLSAIVLTGLQGMGRGTLAAELVRDAFRGMRPGGPVFDLPEAGDGVDWHLKFFEDLNGGITRAEAEAQISAFQGATAIQQAEILVASLKHWGEINQVVTIRNRWGMRDKGNMLRPWMANLLKLLAKEPSVKLILISERQLPKDQVESLGNVIQFVVEELPDETIEYILSDRIDPRYLDVQRLPAIASTVHGHPATANYVSYLVNGGRSMSSLVAVSDPVAAFQDRILRSLFESNALSDLQKRILKLLSWFPRLNFEILSEAFPTVSEKDLLDEIYELVDFSLLDQSEQGRYKAPAVVSSTYRRSTDEHDLDSFRKVAGLLSSQFSNETLDYGLVDSLLVGSVAAGEKLSSELLRIVTASQLLPVMEKEYYEGLAAGAGQAAPHFNRCISLANLALGMRISDDALENLLFFGADSSVRLGIRPESMLAVMKNRGFSTADYVTASYLYHVERDFDGAAKVLAKNVDSGGFRIRNVRLLSRVYLRAGRFADALDALQKVNPARLARDTGLTMMKVKALRGQRSYLEADRLLASLNGMSDDFGDVAIYKAGAALRVADYAQALRHIEEAKRAPKVNRAVLAFLECACQVESGDNSGLAAACDLARAMRRDSDALQLQARAALASGDWKLAEGYVDQIERKDWFDLNVEYRIIEAKLADPKTASDAVALVEGKARRDEVLRQSANTIEGLKL